MADLSLQLSPAAYGTPAYMDLALGPTGDLALAAGVPAITQAVTLRLNSFTQDYFLAMDEGLPYYDQLLTGRQGLTSAFEAAMQNCVLQTPGIVGLLSWRTVYDAAARTLAVSFEAQCQGGTVVFSAPVSLAGE